MHLYFITRGIKNSVDQFITELQGKYLPFQYRDKADQPYQKTMLQLAVRPIQLWELGFPKEHKDVILNTILGQDRGEGVRDKGLWKWLQKICWGVRKALKLESIPPYVETPMLPVNRINVQTIGVGIKEDYMTPQGTEGI